MEKYNLVKSNEYNGRLKKILPGGVHYNFCTPWAETPIHFVKGARSRLWDMDGNEFLDFHAKFGAMLIGHNNPRYQEFLRNFLDRVLAVNHCDIDEEVCEMLTGLIPSAEMVRFGLSGTEMVQNALRLARAYTGKNMFVRFEGHYHGNADNIMGGKWVDPDYPVPVEFKGDSRGTEGRAKNIMQDQSFLLPWNQPAVLEEVVSKYADRIAAIITEPILINGGGFMPQPGYLEKMRELCDRYQIVLIFDEIITGFRVHLGGAQTLFKVTPDLTTMGKAMSGGAIPVSVLGGKREIMKLLEERKVTHAGTYNGYPIGLAAVKATIEILQENNGAAYEKMARFTRQIHGLMIREAQKVGIPMSFQGPVSCACFHCREKEAQDPKELNAKTVMKDIMVTNALAAYGILSAPGSRFFSNISIDEDDLAFFQERIPSALEDAVKTMESFA